MSIMAIRFGGVAYRYSSDASLVSATVEMPPPKDCEQTGC